MHVCMFGFMYICMCLLCEYFFFKKFTKCILWIVLQDMCMCVYIHTYVHTQTQKLYITQTRDYFVEQAYRHVCKSLLYICICMHVCMHACMHACMYICMYTHTHTHRYTTHNADTGLFCGASIQTCTKLVCDICVCPQIKVVYIQTCIYI